MSPGGIRREAACLQHECGVPGRALSSPIPSLNARGAVDRDCRRRHKAVCCLLLSATPGRLPDGHVSAADMFAQSRHDIKSAVANVRKTIWRLHGTQGKKSCPALDAFELHVKRDLAVLEHWRYRGL